MPTLLLGLLLFLAIHSVRIVAPEWRRAQIASVGEGKWKGLYSVISLIGLVLIVWGYSISRPEAAFLYEPPVWMKHVTLTLMLFSFVFLGVSQVPAGRIKAAVRHPMLLAVKIWAFAHLLANGDAASLLLFVALLAWAVIDRISVKRREASGEISAVIPAGPVRNDIIGVGLGVVLYVLFVWKLHEWLFGVSVV
jgi:uncharacterized membrane protein